MTFGSSILMFDHITLNAGSVDTHTFNTSRIAQLSEYFRIVFVANQYNDAIGADPSYTPNIKLRVVAECDSGDAYEYILYPIDMNGGGFKQDVRLRSGEYVKFTFSIINDSSSQLIVSDVQFCPESREEDMTNLLNAAEDMVNDLKASISLSVGQYSDGQGHSYIRITLFVGDEVFTGTAVIEGNIQVSGQLSADELYAALGDMADLTVDHLSTARRIVKYLAQDTSDDNFLDIADEHIHFMAGVYASGTAQATNPYGASLYWEEQVWAVEGQTLATGVTLGADGYPYYNGVRIFTTTTPTSYPVYIYSYNDETKAKFEFDTTPEGYYMPFITLGTGDNQGYSKAFIIKDSTNLRITFLAAEGKEIGMIAGFDGYLDLYGLRRTDSMDFSGWDSGYFSEVIEGQSASTIYTVTFDGSGRPVKITHPDGHECTITW